MKLFDRTAGYYLFWTGLVYFCAGLYLVYAHSEFTHYATMCWLLVLSIPLWCPPVARYFNIEPVMFDFFKKDKEKYPTWADVPDLNKIGNDMSKVIPFPEPKLVPPMPQVAPPKDDHGKTCYSIGLTDNSRVSITMGHTTVTMNSVGVQQLIDQLELFKRQIEANEG